MNQKAGERLSPARLRDAPSIQSNLNLIKDHRMLKFIGGTVGIIFIIGLLVVIGLLSLIF